MMRVKESRISSDYFFPYPASDSIIRKFFMLDAADMFGPNDEKLVVSRVLWDFLPRRPHRRQSRAYDT